MVVEFRRKLPTKNVSVDDSNIIEVPEQMCRNSKEEVQQTVYDNFKAKIGNKEYFKSRILLAPRLTNPEFQEFQWPGRAQGSELGASGIQKSRISRISRILNPNQEFCLDLA